jgi:hypothetical protein
MPVPIFQFDLRKYACGPTIGFVVHGPTSGPCLPSAKVAFCESPASVLSSNASGGYRR